MGQEREEKERVIFFCHEKKKPKLDVASVRLLFVLIQLSRLKQVMDIVGRKSIMCFQRCRQCLHLCYRRDYGTEATK